MPDAPHVPPRVVGIVAGGGSLPREVAEHVKAAGGQVHIVAIAGEGGREHGDFPVTTVGWAQFGALLRALRNAGTTEVVIAGSVRRPDLSALRPDMGFFMNIPAVLRIVASGDYKPRPDPTCATFEPVACDVFITEATFALPVFRHPPTGQEIAKLIGAGKVFVLAGHFALFHLGWKVHFSDGGLQTYQLFLL